MKEGATIKSQNDNGENSGLKVDENMNLVGTPKISNWGKDEEERTVTIQVVLDSKDKANHKLFQFQSQYKEIQIKMEIRM